MSHNHNEHTLKITKTVQCKGLLMSNSLFGFLKKSLHACHTYQHGQGLKGCFYWSRTIFKLGKAVKMQFWMIKFLWPLTSGTINDQVAIVFIG